MDENAQQEQHNSNQGPLSIVSAIVLGALIIGGAYYWFQVHPVPGAAPLSGSSAPTSPAPASAAPSNTVTIYEYNSFDPSCSTCAAVHKAIEDGLRSVPNVDYQFYVYPQAIQPTGAASTTNAAYNARDVAAYCVTQGSQSVAAETQALRAYANAAYADATATPDQIFAQLYGATQVQAYQSCMTSTNDKPMQLVDLTQTYLRQGIVVLPSVQIKVPGISQPVSISATQKNIADVLQGMATNLPQFVKALQQSYAKEQANQ